MKNIIAIISTLLVISSCTKTPETFPDPIQFDCESDAIIVAEKERQAEAVKEFGVNIFQEVIKENESGNAVLSPLSIYSALLLAYEGSACETKKQIMSTLTIGQGNENVSTLFDYEAFMNDLLPSNEDVLFTYANAIFSDANRIETSDLYVSYLEQFYDAETENLDFSQDEAVNAINDWADENTNGKIKEVLEEISSDEIAFLLNAIYYQGDWLNGFAEESTIDAPFNPSFGPAIFVPTMNRDAQASYFQDENTQLVDLDIKGEEYAVSFLSPSNSSSINELIYDENFLNIYQSNLSNLQSGRVLLRLPKFELEGKKQLKNVLSTLGMTDAFSTGSADFSRMGSAGGNIFLTRVQHDTYIKVDEKGIEGAAVTTIGVGTTSVPPAMEFNRPFVFILRHKATGVPIFIGKVENPVE